jgi:aminoglycoside phosphotransferase family enzyme
MLPRRCNAKSTRTSPNCLRLPSTARSARSASSLWRFQSAFVGANTGVLDGRAERGLIRECHGDLRAEHVILGERPSVVDCVEFDPTLRTLDVADDFAFLVIPLPGFELCCEPRKPRVY